LMRIFGNPDRIGCAALSRTLKLAPRENPFVGLGGEQQGVLAQIDQPLPCANGAPRRALAAGRQLMITTLALRAFFESVWEDDPALRASSAHFLAETLARDFSEVRYQGIAPLPPNPVLELREAPRVPGAPAADSVAAPARLEAGALGLGTPAPALDVQLP